MAAGKKPAAKKAGAPSFDSIIEAERLNRKKKENQALADQLLGSKKRRASAPGPGVGSKKTPTDKSLASRIGVVKRSASTSSKPKTNTFAAARATAKPTTQAKSTPSRRSREDRMLEDINVQKDVNVTPRKPTEITIKGTAATGPFVVVGRNFAPGTNAADIETAMEPVAGHIVGVHITSYTPYVNAQIACAEKWGAEAIVAQFNGQKADGRILSLEYKGGGSSYFGASAASRNAPNYDALREQADRERRERKKVAAPQIQDGRYGFSNSRGDSRPSDGRSNGTSTRNHQGNHGLHSDKMMVDAPAVPISQRSRGFR